MTQDELVIMELLEAISGDLREIKDDIRAMRQSLGRMEQHYATMSTTLDRTRGDVDQINARLELHGEAV